MMGNEYGLKMRRETGLSLDRVCPSPFLIVKRPLCGGSAFTSVEFSSVWCDRCNAQFQVYATGDSGFGVSCMWRFYRPREARYLLPHTPHLSLRLTVHWAADPRHPAYDGDICGWVGDCAPGALKLTDEHHPAVRAGLHYCTLGEICSWYLEGHVPSDRDLKLHCSYDPIQVDGETWPLCTAIPAGQGASQPAVYSWAKLPPFTRLQPDEWYLLHHWRLGAGAARPVWYKVRPYWADDRFCTITELDIIDKGHYPCDGKKATDSG
jgi:hypothetical protein